LHIITAARIERFVSIVHSTKIAVCPAIAASHVSVFAQYCQQQQQQQQQLVI